jgi:hypothetical protein
VMARLLVVICATVALALSACGGGGDSSSTTTTTDQTAVHWSRCPTNSGYGMSVAGISCQEAQRHMPLTKGLTGSATSIRISDPNTFIYEGFDCTQFPLEDGYGTHIVCAKDDQHFSLYFTP